MSQTVRTCKKKKNIQWKIHRYKITSLFQITAGYNQWCPRLHHKGHTVQVIPSMHTVQAIPSIHTSTSNSLKKRKKRWGQRREKEEEADEKAMETERRKKRKEGRRGIEEREEEREEDRECGAKDAPPLPSGRIP